MKNLFLLLLTFSFFSVNAQITQIKPKPGLKRCDGKSTTRDSLRRKGNRFSDFECGKTPGIIDCNEGLESDPGSNIVTKKAIGTEFLQDANKPFTGKCETCHHNGILERQVSFVNGKENGTDTTFYETGCPMVYRTHIEGVENGKWTFFHDTTVSIIAWEMNYFAGEKHGQQIYFSKKGDTTLIENYKNGILDGKKTKYFPGNKIDKEINYKNGLMDGEVTYYNRDGKVIEKLNFKEGKKNGECTYFYNDGKLLSTEFWLMDAKNGEFKTFFYQGDLQKLESWKKSSGKPMDYMTADVYECTTKEEADKVAKLVAQNKKIEEITAELGEKVIVNFIPEKEVEISQRHYLNDQLVKGLNKPFKSKENYYVINMISLTKLAKTEIKDGNFEEYHPNKKPKRIAVYRKDALIEEHTYDEFGNELTSFGGKTTKKTEDDTVTGGDKKKKKKK